MPVWTFAAALLAFQADAAAPAPARPSIECSAHLTDNSALVRCLRGLLSTADAELDAALRGAGAEAAEIDEDMPGLARAAARLDAAQNAWTAYREAECTRRGSLLMIGDAGEEAALDCRVAMTRARAAEMRSQ